MTNAGAAALASVWGWLAASVLPPVPSARSLAAGAAASLAVAGEALLIGGTAAALAAVAGIAGGAAGQRIWLGTLRARIGSTREDNTT